MFSSVLLCCCFLYPLEFFSKPICNYNYCGSGIICLLRTTLFSASNFPEVQLLTCLCRNLPIGSHHKLKGFKVFHWAHLWPQETITLLPFKSYTRKDSVKLLLLSFCNKEVYWWYSSKKDCGIRWQGKRKEEMVIRGQREQSPMGTLSTFCLHANGMLNRWQEWTGSKIRNIGEVVITELVETWGDTGLRVECLDVVCGCCAQRSSRLFRS